MRASAKKPSLTECHNCKLAPSKHARCRQASVLRRLCGAHEQDSLHTWMPAHVCMEAAENAQDDGRGWACSHIVMHSYGHRMLGMDPGGWGEGAERGQTQP